MDTNFKDEELSRRSKCPIAASLDILGDKWILLLIRDLLTGKSRFSEFRNSAEKISANILTDKLRRLTVAGLVEKKLYQRRPPRYEYHLTKAGIELIPILKALAVWTSQNLPGQWSVSDEFLNLTPEKWLSIMQPDPGTLDGVDQES